MFRYIRLYFYFLQFSISKTLEFRMDFFFRILMDGIFYAVNIAFYRLIYIHTESLGGWREDEIMVFVGGYLFIDALIMTFVSNNLWWLPQFVNRGDLDYYLIRPVSSLFFLSLRDISINSMLNLFLSLGILTWALSNFQGELTLAGIGFFFVLLLLGAFLYYLIRMLSIIPVFWTISNRGLDMMFWQMARFMERPDQLFTGWVRRILVSLLPFGVMASFPARILMDGFRLDLTVHLLAVVFVFYWVVIALWKIALRSYSSASS